MIKIGIIGTGRIATRFADDLVLVDNIELVAVYNPHEGSASRFVEGKKKSRDESVALAFRDTKVCDDIDWFLSMVDAVYIATPHDTHYMYATRCLEKNKHVLCEKPMSLRADEVRELYSLARAKGVVLREAIKTSYCDGFKQIIEIAKSGKIGKIIDVEAAFSRLTELNLREYTDIENGGSVSELGSYVLLPIVKLLGCDYKKVEFNSILSANGVDSYTRINLTYDYALACGKVGLGVKTEGQLLIAGTNGYILAESPWWLTRHFQVRYEDASRVENYTCKYEKSGLQYELADFISEIIDIENEKKRTFSESGEILDKWFIETGVSERESIVIAEIIEKYLTEYREKRLALQEKTSGKEKVKIWGHRGCSYAYPENTLESFEAAAKLPGITGIELDVQFSADGQIVVFHDETLDRVTDGHGNLRDYTLAELKQLTVAPGTEKASTIPTLREVLECLKPYCEGNGLLINIELKTSVIRYEGIEQATYDLVKECEMGEYIVYSSFLADSIRVIKEIDSDAKTGMLAGAIDDCIYLGEQVGADALHPYIPYATMHRNENWQGRAVRVWNSSEPFYYNDARGLQDYDLRELVMYGTTDIITNVPEKYLEG